MRASGWASMAQVLLSPPRGKRQSKYLSAQSECRIVQQYNNLRYTLLSTPPRNWIRDRDSERESERETECQFLYKAEPRTVSGACFLVFRCYVPFYATERNTDDTLLREVRRRGVGVAEPAWNTLLQRVISIVPCQRYVPFFGAIVELQNCKITSIQVLLFVCLISVVYASKCQWGLQRERSPGKPRGYPGQGKATNGDERGRCWHWSDRRWYIPVASCCCRGSS